MSKTLRILHLTAGSDAGGLSRYLLDLSTALRDAGHEITIAGQKGAWHHAFEAAQIPWIDVPLKGGPLALRRAGKILRQHLAAHPVDLLHTHYRKATLVARKLQHALSPPILYTLHLSHIPMNGPWRWLSDFGDHVHAASSDARAWLVEQAGVDAARITVIPHGIDATKFPVVTPAARQAARDQFNLPSGARVALYVGRLDDPKNESWLLDVAARRAVPNLRIFLAGEGPNESDLRRRIARDNLTDIVQLLGHKDPLPLYHAADALLLPSAREGFSLVCAEAMCAGLPVLRTRTSGTSELIAENITGRSVPIDQNYFVRAAIDFMNDSENLKRMSPLAADHIRRHFTFQNQIEQTLALYHRLAKID